MYRGVEVAVTGQPYPTDPSRINVDFGEMFSAVTHMGTVHHEGIPTNWRVVFPAGQYVPEEAPDDSFHFMVTPDYGDFRNIEDLSQRELEPLAATMLGFIDEYPQARAGYNIGPDHSKITAQKWHNLHVHFYQFPDLGHLETREVKSRKEQPLAYRKLHELMWPHIDTVTQWWFENNSGDIPGVVGVENIKWGLEGAFPKGGTTLVLNDNITPSQFAGVLKGVDNVYSGLHRSVFSMFVTNYDTASASRGMTQYSLRDSESIQTAINSFYPAEERMAPFRAGLMNLSRVLKPWDQAANKDQIVIPPSYSVTLLQGNEQFGRKRLLTITPHFLSPSGNSEAEGIFPNRTTTVGASIDSRVTRADAAFSRLSRRGLMQRQ